MFAVHVACNGGAGAPGAASGTSVDPTPAIARVESSAASVASTAPDPAAAAVASLASITSPATGVCACVVYLRALEWSGIECGVVWCGVV